MGPRVHNPCSVAALLAELGIIWSSINSRDTGPGVLLPTKPVSSELAN